MFPNDGSLKKLLAQLNILRNRYIYVKDESGNVIFCGRDEEDVILNVIRNVWAL
jgi:hypothetical protein